MTFLAAITFVLAQGEVPVDTTYFLQLENIWNRAHMLADTTALDSLWDEALVINAPQMRPISKAEAMAFWRSGRVKFLQYESSNIRAQGTAVNEVTVSGTLIRKRQIGDKILEERLQFEKIYRKGAKGWRVVLWTAMEANSK